MSGIPNLAERRDDRGSSIVEAVLIVPLFAIGALVLVHVCMGLLGDSAAQAAARHGLLAATAYQGTDAAGRAEATAYVHAVAPRFLPDPHVEVTRTGTSVSVRVSGPVLSIMPWPRLRADARVSGPLERFVAPG